MFYQQINKEALDDTTLFVYPPMLKLVVKLSDSNDNACEIKVDILGITEPRKIRLNTKRRLCKFSDLIKKLCRHNYYQAGALGIQSLAVDCRNTPKLSVLCNILAGLTISKTRGLVLQLCGNTFPDVDYAPVEERRLCFLENWLKIDTNPTWVKVVNALNTPAIRENAMAEKIRAEYCPHIPPRK